MLAARFTYPHDMFRYRLERLIHEGTFVYTYAAVEIGKGRRYCIRTEPMTQDESLKKFKVLKARPP